ncbi:hypothetical protein N7492_009024 [Penicillium capsulatum]|uniref:Uncharacterized protein n=1 Tax=Penicillium capsulatum TaxID=69766 RepID=A0A9W9LGH7_9EURO|nr:hypothetical protein N7492_009024 [Penicillium capsulatum]KAJ6106423.1 hypothetical protein N7512_009940 [Penicillium capsulatum]
MPSLKDGPMACTHPQMAAFTGELRQLRAHCIYLLQKHREAHPDQPWTPADGPGPSNVSEADLPKLKLVTTIAFDNGKPQFPPPKTRLSDELVYLATKFLKAGERGILYPYDFLLQGDINPDRIPSDPCPIIWAHGLPFFPVFKGYYILCGRQHADWVGWLLRQNARRLTKDFPYWTIGPVVAPGTAVELPRTVERQLHVHKPTSMKDCEKGMEKAATARDVVSALHNHGSVVPKTSSGGFVISELYRVPGYNVRCGPNYDDGQRSQYVDSSWFAANAIEDFDYMESVNAGYFNERNPRVIFSDSEDELAKKEPEVQAAIDQVKREDPAGCSLFDPAVMTRQTSTNTTANDDSKDADMDMDNELFYTNDDTSDDSRPAKRLRVTEPAHGTVDMQ